MHPPATETGVWVEGQSTWPFILVESRNKTQLQTPQCRRMLSVLGSRDRDMAQEFCSGESQSACPKKPDPSIVNAGRCANTALRFLTHILRHGQSRDKPPFDNVYGVQISER